MVLEFDTRGNEKQKLCASKWCDHVTEEISYGGAKGGAKSYTGVSLVFGDALMYPKTRYFIARKKLNDLRKHTIPSIHEVLESWGISSEMYKFNGQDSLFKLYNQSEVLLLDAKYLPSDPEYHRFGSMQMTRGWIEEGGEFERASYQNLKISIGRWKNDVYNLYKKLLITSNPSKNFLYKDFYLPNKNGTLEEWKCMIQALPYDNKMLTKGYLENLERTLTGNAKKRLLGGDWEYDDDPTALCDYEKILEIFKNDHLQKYNKRYITADIARYGSDKAVIGVWDGWVLIEVYTLDISKTTEIQALINTLRIKHQIPKSQCIADDDGVGGGVVDNCDIMGFVNNSVALKEKDVAETTDKLEKPNYKNLQTQCLYRLAKRINNNGIYIESDLQDSQKDDIVEELESIKSDNEDISKLKVISKEAVKDIIGRSPDYRDMLLMREWFELEPKQEVFFF
ncbi:terminase [Elizabethkingia anophelis]|nr:terminase [Elizabethkingia anophelis]